MLRHRSLLVVLCLTVLSFMHASQGNTNTVLIDHTCVKQCLDSPRCGWITLDGTLNKCFINDSLDCSLLRDNVGNGVVLYRRMPLPVSNPGKCQMKGFFELMKTTDTTCLTTLASCASPPYIANSVVQYDLQIPGSVARYVCNEGFSFCGTAQKDATCLTNGSWAELGLGCVAPTTTWVNIVNVTEPLPCPVRVGSVLEIIGTSNGQFVFRLLDGPVRSILYMQVRFPERIVVLNVRYRNYYWGPEKRPSSFPLTEGQAFNMTIVTGNNDYTIMVDGQLFYKYKHMLPFTDATAFLLDGELSLSSFKFRF